MGDIIDGLFLLAYSFNSTTVIAGDDVIDFFGFIYLGILP
jgi:hypothetical protein